jgi:L-fuculose-phosphate aldolase
MKEYVVMREHERDAAPPLRIGNATMSRQSIRKEIVAFARRMRADQLVVGTAGNISVRLPEKETVAITPSSLPYEEMQPEDVPIIDLHGTVVLPGRTPSTEHALHLAIYRARSDVGAIFHTHSLYSSVLAALHVPLPPITEEVVHYVGGQVDVAKYAPTQSPELSTNVIVALGDKAAVFLANHGNVCCEADLASAYHICQLIERVAQLYILACLVGTPIPIPSEVIAKERLAFEARRRRPYHAPHP